MPTIAIYVSEDQYATLVAQARTQNLKVSEYVKTLVFGNLSSMNVMRPYGSK